MKFYTNHKSVKSAKEMVDILKKKKLIDDFKIIRIKKSLYALFIKESNYSIFKKVEKKIGRKLTDDEKSIIELLIANSAEVNFINEEKNV